MFEFGRELRRLLGGAPLAGGFQDGLTGGDPTLLELLDLRLLINEARAADVAAGRIGARDRPARLVHAAITWREVARRSGDPVALRKAASAAEAACAGFVTAGRSAGVSRAKAEQGLCGMLGADLFGDDGLNAAAERVLEGAVAGSGLGAAAGTAALAGLRGRMAMARGDSTAVEAAAAAFDAPLAALTAAARAGGAARLALVEHRLARAEMLALAGARLKDSDLVDRGAREAGSVVASLDAAYEPLSHARAATAHGTALALKAELTGEIEPAADAVEILVKALEQVPPDHSPLDWAGIQAALGQALIIVGEVSDCPRPFEQAVTCFERAATVLKTMSALTLRARAASGRAHALGRQAEMTGDLAVLDIAVAAQKSELCALRPASDPVAWAIAQLNLARLYEIRADITGRDDGGLAAASVALATAFDVFAEQGMRSLTEAAAEGLSRLRGREKSF